MPSLNLDNIDIIKSLEDNNNFTEEQKALAIQNAILGEKLDTLITIAEKIFTLFTLAMDVRIGDEDK